MKKILAIALCLAIALISAIAMSINAFADAEPIVWDYTKEEATGLVPGDPVHDWGAKVTGTTTYDATEKALKIVDGKKLISGAQAYALINDQDQPLVDWDVYKYMAISYKTISVDDSTVFYLMTDGAAGFATLPESADAYNKLVVDTNNGDGRGGHIGIAEGQFGGVTLCLSWYTETGIPEGGTGYYVQYIAFFETEAEANAFDISTYTAPETTEPETSEPEVSEPETSEPETSEPETSKPENSQSEGNKPNTNTSDVAIISGAILLCAAAATVVAVSRKRK